MRVAVRLVVVVAAAANAEAVESRFHAIMNSVSRVQQAGGNCDERRDNAQFNKACTKPAKCALGAIGEANIHLPASIAGIESALAGVDATSNLHDYISRDSAALA